MSKTDMHGKNYSEHLNLISTTDPDSIVTYANSHFCDVSEFTEEDLLGNPHNVVRHPEMPKAAFAQMWQYLKSGQSWMGLVKNRCKEGGHYWVSAFVTPIKAQDGSTTEYQSVRSKPSKEQIERAEQTYQKLNSGSKASSFRIPYLKLSFILCAVMLLAFAASIMMPSLSSYLSVAGLISGGTLLFVSVKQAGRFRHIRQLAEQSYSNPLMEKIYTGHFDDFSTVELALIMKKAELRAVAGRTGETAECIAASADKEFKSMQGVERSLEEQFANTEQVATAVEELSHSIREVADSASSATSVTDEAQQESEKGLASISETIEVIDQLSVELVNSGRVINQLSESSQKIESILDVIGNISEQTNLLALNAAIEAARAGEAGRGFAVVADEVRSLANKTRSSTDEIQQMIAELQSSAGDAVEIMGKGESLSQQCLTRANETGEVLNNISSRLNAVTDNSHQIAVAVEEQASVTQEVSRNVSNIRVLANDTLSSSRESVSRTEELVVNLNGLQRLIKQFQS
ncbi:methyl-accepting chemotaxis protein [Vibrio sp. SCSIO 43137]|uniref:methyl-accepting chemotaxis protein n=1 Tax=Vibrio sp. SCSIO 43137 TaxID=3021011 RepID=UPI002308101D|nr:PAS domain-containing methyl-accepting chemotaxis protein [Vibrio sp. SCSIO 43137]WCE30321.1 PAS domain-containing methyl-accepting chemotaxis protein [Vibrio sp. SCSIO 43137]